MAKAIHVVIPVLFGIDIVLKMIARRFPREPFIFVSTFLGPIGFIPSVNDVLAFSLPISNVWIWPVGWLVVFVLARACWRTTDHHVHTAIAAVILGALSNLVDRTFLGGVTDYLSLTDFFPAFNIADLLIIGGVCAWVWTTRRTEPLRPS